MSRESRERVGEGAKQSMGKRVTMSRLRRVRVRAMQCGDSGGTTR